MRQTDLHDPVDDDPHEMTAADRQAEVATILAEGVLRLHRRRTTLDPESLGQITADSPRDGLEIEAQSPLHRADRFTPQSGAEEPSGPWSER